MNKSCVTDSELAYPLIIIEPQSTLRFIRRREDLITCRKGLIRQKYFEQSTILASDGRKYTIEAVRIIEANEPWWRRRLFNYHVRIALNLIYEGPITLEETKKEVVRVLDYQEVSEALGRCADLNELIHYIGKMMEPIDAAMQKYR